MADFVQFELEDGTPVLFETEESNLVRRHGGAGELSEGGALGEKLTGAAETAQAVSKTLRERLHPDELTLELGLKVSGQANWFVAKAQTEGNIKVTLKWTNDPAIRDTSASEDPPAPGDAPS